MNEQEIRDYLEKENFAKDSILNLNEEDRKQVLVSLAKSSNQYGFNILDIREIICSIDDEDFKEKIIEELQLTEYEAAKVISTFSDESKKNILLERR